MAQPYRDGGIRTSGLLSRMRPNAFAAWLLGGCLALAFFAEFARAAKPHGAAEETKTKVSFLVARRGLADPNFQESVVLMLPSERMPLIVGVIVNKPMEVPLNRIYPQIPALKNSKATAYFGGPVDIDSATLLFRSAKPPKNALPLFSDAYLTFDPDLIPSLLGDPKQKGDQRIILGRAQWAPEQLDNEMRREAWYRLEAEGELIFDPDPEHLWRRMLERAERVSVRNLLSEPRLPEAM